MFRLFRIPCEHVGSSLGVPLNQPENWYPQQKIQARPGRHGRSTLAVRISWSRGAEKSGLQLMARIWFGDLNPTSLLDGEDHSSGK